MATVTSKQFTLNWRDLLRGAFMAGIGAILPIIYDLINSGQLEFDFNKIWKGAALAALAYLIKNFLSPAEITITPASDQQIEAIKSGDAKVVVKSTNQL